jgi:hypothetical protein
MNNQFQCGCRDKRCEQPCDRGNFLLPKILASGREWMRRQCVQLRLCGVDECACEPFTLITVEQCGAVAAERAGESCQRGQMVFLLKIPVTAQVRDGRGCIHTACAVVEARAAVNMRALRDELWCSQTVAYAAVRLINCPPPSCDLCFDALLDLCAEVYLVRYEPCRSRGACEPPPCPQLPLYPQMPCC